MALQQIDSKHLAALESEIARLRAQRDALRDAVSELVAEFDEHNAGRDPCREGILRDSGGMTLARSALQSCAD